MYLTYTPDGQAEQKWEFKLGKLRASEAEGIERRTKMAFDTEFRQALLQGNVLARRALLWTMLRRQHHTLRFEDLDFAADEVKVTMDLEEWREARRETERIRGVDEEDKALALAMIDQSIDDLEAAEPDNGERVEGKAPEPIGE